MLPLSRAVGPVIMSIEEKMEADARSIYVGNVSKRSNPFRRDQNKERGSAVFSLKYRGNKNGPRLESGMTDFLSPPSFRWTTVPRRRSWRLTFMAAVQ